MSSACAPWSGVRRRRCVAVRSAAQSRGELRCEAERGGVPRRRGELRNVAVCCGARRCDVLRGAESSKGLRSDAMTECCVRDALWRAGEAVRMQWCGAGRRAEVRC